MFNTSTSIKEILIYYSNLHLIGYISFHTALTLTFTQTHTLRQDLHVCVPLALAYFAYLRWAVTVPHGGRHSAPAGPAALPPRGPRPPVSVQALREGAERHTFPLVAPLARTGGEFEFGSYMRASQRDRQTDRNRRTLFSSSYQLDINVYFCAR